MRGIKFGITLLALVLGWSSVMASNNAMAQTPDVPPPNGTIEVHARICDDVPADWYAECHDNVSPDTFVQAYNDVTGETAEGTTDASGNVVIEVPPGSWYISSPPGDTIQESFVYCSYSDAPGEDLGHPVVVEGEADVICDYFFVPDDLSIPTTPATVNVNLCIAAGCSELPEAIEPVDGVAVELTNVDNDTEIDTCTSGDSRVGTCDVDIPEVSSFSVLVDPNTIPDGYMSEPNPSVYEWNPENPDIWILLLPVDGFPPGDNITPVPPVPLPVPLALELPSALYAGTCEDVESAASVEELNDLTIVEGDDRGAAEAIVAASGYTPVPMTINNLLDSEHSVIVFDEDDPDMITACGAIGGALDQDGSLSVGLAQVDDSGAAGVAYLAPGADGSVTDVSVFLVPDGLIPTPESTPIG